MRAIEAGTASEQKWTELIRQQQQSGLSVSVFCRDRGFSDQAFYYWRKRLSVTVQVVETVLSSDGMGSALRWERRADTR
jgi:hypothetical protein